MSDDQRRPAPDVSWLSAAASALSAFALVTIALVALVMIVVPLLLGATPYTVLTGSMRPSMPPGTLVVTRPTPVEDIRVGDVVTYQRRSGLPGVVTHRVVGIGASGAGERVIVVRGDANGVADPPVLPVQIRGVVVYHAPYLGYLNTWVGANRPTWVTRAVAGSLLGYGAFLLAGAVRDRRRRAAAGTAAAGDDADGPTEPGPRATGAEPAEPRVPAAADGRSDTPEPSAAPEPVPAHATAAP
ncbi:signal peptidase I [Cellulomonas alba]|uniref:Signal peptidase I n=1 Tax=Cellulomonas alba TaxID=3053467 RepID=A0ABT7SDZ1_9CELL|nr:signal peptidase I [Cellulomonas alba]MDM7854394.1 signal peptidase I [Cellulomonas alba]